jgi:hypothetical protein
LVQSSGPSAGVVFVDRSKSTPWQWFGSGGTANLWSARSIILRIDDTGKVNTGGNITLNGANLQFFDAAGGTLTLPDQHIVWGSSCGIQSIGSGVAQHTGDLEFLNGSIGLILTPNGAAGISAGLGVGCNSPNIILHRGLYRTAKLVVASFNITPSANGTSTCTASVTLPVATSSIDPSSDACSFYANMDPSIAGSITLGSQSVSYVNLAVTENRGHDADLTEYSVHQHVEPAMFDYLCDQLAL